MPAQSETHGGVRFLFEVCAVTKQESAWSEQSGRSAPKSPPVHAVSCLRGWERGTESELRAAASCVEELGHACKGGRRRPPPEHPAHRTSHSATAFSVLPLMMRPPGPLSMLVIMPACALHEWRPGKSLHMRGLCGRQAPGKTSPRHNAPPPSVPGAGLWCGRSAVIT